MWNYVALEIVKSIITLFDCDFPSLQISYYIICKPIQSSTTSKLPYP